MPAATRSKLYAEGYSGSDGFLLAEGDSGGKSSRHCLPFIVDSGYSFAVKGIPGTIQEDGAAFATTHWSFVAACTDDSETADAQDLVQGFFNAARCFPFARRWTTSAFPVNGLKCFNAERVVPIKHL